MMLTKDFLSIEDLADYLNSLGWSYDLSISRDHYRLHKDIYDLVVQEKIHLVFHHTGHVKETICDNDIDKVTGKLKNCTSKILYISAYFKISPFLARRMLLDNKFATTQGSFNLYSFKDGKKNPDVIHTFYLYDIIDDNEQNITSNDLYIPRDEIEELFNRNNQTSYEQKILDLGNQLARAELENTSVDDEPTHHKTINSMATLVATLLKLASYDKQDLENPHGNINKEIIAKAEGLGLTLGKDFIAKWLKKADEVL